MVVGAHDEHSAHGVKQDEVSLLDSEMDLSGEGLI